MSSNTQASRLPGRARLVSSMPSVVRTVGLTVVCAVAVTTGIACTRENGRDNGPPAANERSAPASMPGAPANTPDSIPDTPDKQPSMDKSKQHEQSQNERSQEPGHVQVALQRKRGRPAVDVTLTVPAGWRQSAHYGANTWEPAEQPDPRLYTTAGLQVQRCAKAQGDDMPAEARAARDNHAARAERPNVNTGKPELDAVRAQVKVLQDQAIPGGWIHVIRVEYADELLAKGPYQPHVSVQCYFYGAGRDYFVTLASRLPLAAEARYLPDIESMCHSVEIIENLDNAQQ